MLNNPHLPTPVFEDLQNRSYSGTSGDYMDAGHHGSLELPSGTISLSFSIAEFAGDKAIISKDGYGRENGGHLSVWVKDGTMHVLQESATESKWLKVPDLVLSANTTYQLGVTFGDDGLNVWLNGELVAAEPEFKQGIEDNGRSLVIGGSRGWLHNDSQDAHSLFEGEIGNVMVFDQQLGESEMLALTEAIDPALDDAARMAAMMEDLLPVLGDIHHGSETFKDFMASYGATEHGHLTSMPAMQTGTDGNDILTGGPGADGINGGMGNDRISGAGGDDILQGSYGNDTLLGGAGRDILDGGHGEDNLYGGGGDDLLISRADGREGEIYYDPDRDEGDPLGELTNGKLYPDQPIPGDDVLTGGTGADIFYFQTLINAKERYIEKHTRDDGSINWHRVAGENDKLHDHWVDVIGANDTVMDFNRADGDRLVIEGHTTKIAINYGDINGDGIMDHSVIELYSDQGSGGGAHNDDRLGTITVYGDLVKNADIEHTAAPAYGIVHTIDDLQEAITPKTNGTNAPDTAPPSELPGSTDLNLTGVPAPIFAITGNHAFTGDEGDYMDAGHHGSLELPSGTISLSFSIAEFAGDKAIISKDGYGRENGGHLSVWVKDGTMHVLQESATESKWLKVPDLVLSANTTYQLGVTFGDDGLNVWLNGELVAAEPEFKQGIEDNGRSLVIGGSRGWLHNDSQDAHSLFEGEIGNVMVFDQQLGESEMLALTEAIDPALDDAARMAAMMEDLLPVLGDIHHGSETFKDFMASYGATEHGHLTSMPAMQTGTDGNDILTGGPGADGINGGMGNDRISGAGGDDILQGSYGNDTLLGGAGRDILDGGHGEDNLYGGGGDDLLISRADGREGEIYYDPDRDEGDPLGELTNGKLYPDQPIPGDDVLTGGTGADIFYFQTLINAKERYIEKHTRDDGSINWHRVAGENDKLHDHWVDVIGANDTVMDFNRADGDRLVIEGHTTKIAINYGDINGDGIMDHSVIELYSDQGSGGGAHNDDRLGTITVYGDLVKNADIEHTAAPAYGIVHTIDDLQEAITPKTNGTNAPDTAPPSELPGSTDLNLTGVPAPIFAITGNHAFTGDEGDYMDAGHHGSLELPSGTISLSFSIAEFAGDKAIISKDGYGRENGGHLSVWVKDGTMHVLQESATESKWLKVPDLVLSANTTYQLGVTFGDDGLNVWLNGELVAAAPEFKQGIEDNGRSLVIGGSKGWFYNDSKDAHSLFEGEIGNVMVFDQQLGESEMLALAEAIDQIIGTSGNDRLQGTNDDEVIKGNGGADLLIGKGGADSIEGGDGNDRLRGGEGADRLEGGSGQDTADYTSATSAVRVDLDVPTVNQGDAAGDTYSSIERVIGSRHADYLRGDAAGEHLNGWHGDDLVRGRAGDDRLVGGSGNDTLEGQEGTDRLIGNSGGDTFVFAPRMDRDVVIDFQNDVDVLDFSAFGFANVEQLSALAETRNDGADLYFDLDNDDTLIIKNTTLALAQDDFLI